MTPSTRIFDELSKVMTSATGAAQTVRREIDGVVQAQVERILNNLDLVRREDFNVVRDMAAKAREDNELLARRLNELEAKLNSQG